MGKKLLALLLAFALGAAGITSPFEAQAKEIYSTEEDEDWKGPHGSIETAQTWNGAARQVSVEDGEESYFKFVPKADGIYTLFSTGEEDTYGELYDGDGSLLCSNDDNDVDGNFELTWYLYANRTYYLNAYGNDWREASFVINTAQRQADGLELFYAENLSVAYGQRAGLEASAVSSKGPVSYQWYKGRLADDCRIEGATASRYELPGDNEEKMFYCQVTDGAETEVAEFNISIDTGLAVSSGTGENEDWEEVSDSGPRYVTLPYGDTITLEVTASGGVNGRGLSYQWQYAYFDDYDEEVIMDIEGETGDRYALKADMGCKEYYYCKVSDGINEKSIKFFITVETGLRVDSAILDEEGESTSDVAVEYGRRAELKVKASGGVGELKYQWYKSDEASRGHIIEGATQSSYFVTGDAACGTDYYCEVTDGIAAVGFHFYVSLETGLRVESALKNKYGDEVTVVLVPLDGEMDLKVKAWGGAGELEYQWYRAGYADEDYIIEGEDSDSFEVLGEEDNEGSYYCEVTDGVIKKGIEFIVSVAEIVSIRDCDISIDKAGAYYTGSAVEPEVTVEYEGNELEEGLDYYVSYKNNVKIGKAKVIIEGVDEYIGTVTKAFTIKAKKGKVYAVKDYKYKVTGEDQVAFAGLKNSKVSKVDIPKKVDIGGKKFKVTSIANNALKKSKVISITVGDNVKAVGNSAFEGCRRLTKVTLGKGVAKVGTNVFKNCRKLGNITVKSTKVKSVGKNALKGIKTNAKVKVPAKKLKAYKGLFKAKGQGKKCKISK